MNDARLPGLITLAVLALAFAHAVHAQGSQCTGQPNNNPLYETQDNMQLVASTANGKLFITGPADNQISVAHFYGTPYQMGYAHGQLLKPQIDLLYDSFYPWIDEQVLPYLKFLPKVVADAIATGGAKAGLELEAIMTEPWTPQHFLEEMQGLADGAGYTYRQIHQFQMFPELIKAACTMVGAWGSATGGASSYGNDTNLLAMRLLDWGTANPMRLVPVLAVYHPLEGDGHAFASQTFAGFIGSITGYSTETNICEKVWISSNETLLEGRFGYPWAFMLRDILQYDNSIADAYARLEAARRTASIWIGVGGRSTGQFRVFESSYDQLHELNWNSPFPGYEPQPPQHPTIQDVVYVDKHVQPSHDPCLGSLLQEGYGSLAPAYMEQTVAALTQSGDLMAVVFDFDANLMDVAVASQLANVTNVINAYDRQYLRFNMTQLFNLPL